jgi:uncharacterized LabA/DUF88 family protein
VKKTYYFPEHVHRGARAMIFVDGENLAIRYKEMLGDNSPQEHVTYIPDVAVWTRYANAGGHTNCEVVRRYYYTSCFGDETRLDEVRDALKNAGIQQPRVFKRPKNGRSKRVDISLATDMLSHAHRRNYDVAVLVTGDEDFVPLVEAVVGEGRRVVLWSLESGLSKKLEQSVDHCFDLGTLLFDDYLTLNSRLITPT